MIDEQRVLRLINLINYLDVRKIEFAKKMGIQNQYLSAILTRKKPVSEKSIQRIIKAYPQVNPMWLLYGAGNMIINQQETIDIEYEEVHQTPMLVEESSAPFKQLPSSVPEYPDSTEALSAWAKSLEQRIATLEEKFNNHIIQCGSKQKSTRKPRNA